MEGLAYGVLGMLAGALLVLLLLRGRQCNPPPLTEDERLELESYRALGLRPEEVREAIQDMETIGQFAYCNRALFCKTTGLEPGEVDAFIRRAGRPQEDAFLAPSKTQRSCHFDSWPLY